MSTTIGRDCILNGKTSLGIELGSTRIKAVLIDQNFEIIGSGIYDWENKLVDGFWTYCPKEIVNGLQEAYRQLAKEIQDKYNAPLQNIGSIGCSAMMQGYIVLDHSGELLVPFRTWRNATTAQASSDLTNAFEFKIPQRWSISHLYQAILNNEPHVKNISYVTTLSGYIHWLLTGKKILGIGDASGMFPIDETKKQFDELLINKFNTLITEKKYPWTITDVLPKVLTAGEPAGNLHEKGARLLDPSGLLNPGVPMCPPEGDGGTGIVATNSIEKRTGNISVGTSIFAQFVLEKKLSKIYSEIDIMTTPEGNPVGIILANNCSTDINAWINIFGEFHEAMGLKADRNQLFNILFNKAMTGDHDCGGLLSYGYYSAENITGISKGRPLFVRTAESRFNLANLMRTHLYSAFAVLRIGMEILTNDEKLSFGKISAHGGLFKTPGVGQKICAAALNVPVSLMSTASEGGAWGMAILASYLKNKNENETLATYLSNKVFNEKKDEIVHPDKMDKGGFDQFLKRYKKGLHIAKAAENYT
ncbi:xylulokinase [Epilithonimonas mollis]|uniref:Sugar (Pentulose or hexulose) kinase n=1 Tax=Epilithonimonas mollis TaxID=216903 RepID=A0A1M6UUQ5_9FLAO|nr:FGGY-family carbohydrate kinase [Epilithonimonas mollis]SHK72904.1 Sugar (pentulose or hexulose) kinase [Epilithonimonas mollis]